MYIAASTRCFSSQSFEDACQTIGDLEYDKVEIWMCEAGDHLKPSAVAADPERFAAQYRETTRLKPVAFCLSDAADSQVVAGISKVAKLIRVTQITLPASPQGTPFNTEIDRLRELVAMTNQDGIQLSVLIANGTLMEDPQTAVEFCQSVPGLGLSLDPSHFIHGPHAGEAHDQVYPFVYQVHLRDTSKDNPQVPVGLGDVDYSRLVNQLRRARYGLALTVDIDAKLCENDSHALEMRKLRMLLESLL
ncbi:MAG: sugar phosphate isomerase/epimerase [Planctomycetes bacterium]|nr:sugar phosphate isomerase/epimerase [Planctomycetota bacterium]